MNPICAGGVSGVMRFLAILCLLAATARADDVTALRKAAEKLERDARQSNDLTKYVACGQAYNDIYNKFPGSAADEVLYNAAICFREGKAYGAALQGFDLLLRTIPNSKLAPRALAASAHLYASIAHFDKAAERLEQYAKRYAGEKDAVGALSDAAYYRRALGDHARAIENTQLFVRLYGRKNPREAAQAMLNLTAAYDGDPDAQIKHLRSVVKTYRLDDGQLALVHAKLGDALSAKSCSVSQQEGLCVKLERERAPAKARCSTDPVRLVAVKRAAPARREALAAYTSAARLFDRLPQDHAIGKYYAAHAKVALADAELESLLGLAPPKGKNLDAWLRDATTALDKVNGHYEAIIKLRDTAALHASARIGQSVQTVWRALRLADHDCKVVDALAVTLAKRAGDAFDVCVRKAAELGVVDGHTRMCHREGQLLDPARFPPPAMIPDPESIPLVIVADKIGEPDWRAGRRAAAIKAWEAALRQNGKLFAPRINLAIARFEQMRGLPASDAATRKQLAADITFQAQNALALADDPTPLVLLAALALEDKRTYGLANLLLEIAVRTHDKYAPAHVGLGVLAVRRDQWSAALVHFERAASLDPKSEAIELASALAALRAGRFDAAAQKLATIKTASYDVELARGVAARGLGKVADAKAAYKRALKLDGSRPEAKHNLGLLAP